MNEPAVMVYLMTGFLDSGKTDFLKFTLAQEYFQIEEKTLLILCEEGEEEYDMDELAACNVVVETVDSQEEFTSEWLKEMNAKHHPARVVIEYNGMWRVSEFEQMELPYGWGIEQKLTTVDASTFQVYAANMMSLFTEMVRGSDLVLFNRCTDIKPLAGYRRSVKVVNPQATIIFEDEEGEIENIFENDVPYDLDADVIEVLPEDYGIWYLDAMERPNVYRGKVVEYTAKIMKPKAFPQSACFPGRMAMTCCADDMSFLGYVLKGADIKKLKAGEWVKIRAKIGYEVLSIYEGLGPVLHAISVEPAEEIEDLVYFN